VNGYYQEEVVNGQKQVLKEYQAGGRIAERRGDNLFYLHQDHLGSTTLLTDPAGVAMGSAFSYFPYGGLTEARQTSTSYMYTGQELDSKIKLYNYKARLYNPEVGVFISPDNLGGGYQYVAGNPLTFTDPTGQMLEAGSGGGGGGGLAPDNRGPVYQPDWMGASAAQPASIGATGTSQSTVGVALPGEAGYAQTPDWAGFKRMNAGLVGASLGVPILTQVPAAITACLVAPQKCGEFVFDLLAPEGHPGVSLASSAEGSVRAAQGGGPGLFRILGGVLRRSKKLDRATEEFLFHAAHASLQASEDLTPQELELLKQTRAYGQQALENYLRGASRGDLERVARGLSRIYNTPVAMLGEQFPTAYSDEVVGGAVQYLVNLHGELDAGGYSSKVIARHLISQKQLLEGPGVYPIWEALGR